METNIIIDRSRATQIRCECGVWSGTECQIVAESADMDLVEWMPEHLRESHEAAGNSGSWPANGALRLRVDPGCALEMQEFDGYWTSVIETTEAAQ